MILLEFFQRKKANCDENYLGKNRKLDRLIVMDNICLADRSEAFANFLTVSGNSCWTDSCLHFLYNLSNKTALANDTYSNQNI